MNRNEYIRLWKEEEEFQGKELTPKEKLEMQKEAAEQKEKNKAS